MFTSLTFTTSKSKPLDKIKHDLGLLDVPTATMQQVHGNVCKVVSRLKTQELSKADACLTSLPGLVLQVKSADCLPILLSHPAGVIGAIHAGRQGTELGILQHTLQLMKKLYGIDSGLKVWFGPAICEECYQINQATDKHYNLVAENLAQLTTEFPHKTVEIILSEQCTCHEPELFHSYRREGTGVPMNYAGIVLTGNP